MSRLGRASRLVPAAAGAGCATSPAGPREGIHDNRIAARPRRAVRVAALAGMLLALLACLLPASAAAHAQLESTTPQRGAVLSGAPERVVFRFSEPVEASFGAVRVFDAAGGRVDEGDAFHPGDRSDEIAVALRRDLPDGTYTATYRVVSADSHVISSGIVFSIGRAGAAGKTVGELLAGSDAGADVDALLGIARGVQFGAIALALGALAFLVLVWRRALPEALRGAAARSTAASAFAARLRLIVCAAAAAGALSGLLGIAMQGAEAAGLPALDGLRPAIVRETLETRFGTVWGVGVVAWLALGALAWALLRDRGSRRGGAGTDEARGDAPAGPAAAAWLLALPAAWLLLLPGLGGHAAVQDPVALLLGANVLHVAAMALWTGGLAALLLALPAATRALAEPADRTRLLAAALARFSPLALGAVGAIVLTGVVQSVKLLDLPGDLLDSGFGRAVLAKVALLLGLVAIGAWQRRRSLPRLRALAAAEEPPGGAGVLLRRALRAELLLLAGVLAATAALAASAPGTQTQTGPFDETTAIGPLQLQLTVDPAQVGPNAVHLYVIDPRDGSQFRGARAVRLSATQPDKGIGPVREVPDLAGPGHWTLAAMPFGVAGTWEVRVAVRVSDFDEYETTVEVPIG
ncbi:copper resistance CopC/CopD family protein [Conexibacter arvalis]|uniref:Copper transport protein n=1 Tax=Conexibacter arvalis TaxID=912552 RepID=A0A840IB95_9ACTN|nr:copper resistance protein CopC [Conexibacter arvalis]MBB4661210.1 copper transport protein [Conexibacter arvalis]